MTADQGSAVVEFAVVVPLVIAVLLAGVEVTVLARTQIELTAAAREAAREAATSPDPSRAVKAAQSSLGSRLGPKVRVSVSRPAEVGKPAIVTLVLPHRLAAPLLGGWTVELHARAVMRIER